MALFFALHRTGVGIGLHLNCKTMKTTVFTLCLWLGITGIASGQSFHYLETIPNDFNYTSPQIATDPQGNTYVAGNFGYDLTIDGLTVSNDVYLSIFVAKYNKNGNLIWLRSIESSALCAQQEITYNKITKGILVCGSFGDTLTIGATNYISQGETDGFWASFDAAGNVLNSNVVGGSESDWLTDIGADKNGNIYVSGNSYSDELLFNGISQQMGTNHTGLIAKYSNTGTPIWMRTIVGGDNLDMNNIDVAANGTTYFAFNVDGTYSINNGMDDSYAIIKDDDEKNIVAFSLNKNGETNQFTEFTVSSFYTRAVDIVFDGSVNIAINMHDTVDVYGDSYVSAPDGYDVLIVRVSFTTFDLAWVKHITSPYLIVASTIKSVNGNILVAGDYRQYAACDAATMENPFEDAESFLATIAIPSGTILGLADFDNVEAGDLITDLDADKNNNIYICGLFTGDIYFDAFHGVSQPGKYNIFLTRLNAFILKEENPIAEQSIQVYPNPTTAYITAEGLSGTWHITNMQGQVIMSGESDNEKSTTINVQSLTAGTYLLSYTNNAQQITTQQFIKQ